MYIFDITIFGLHISPTWYGLMYAIGFGFCYFFVGKYGTIKKSELDTLLLYIFLGVIIGGRLGYVLLYNPIFFIENPSEIIAIWNGGMSFHGGFLGVLVAIYIFAKRYSYRFFEITDILAVCIPVALGLGRIGNWINQELPGYTPYDGPFAMVIDGVSHFPSPLLQFLFEGIILGLVLLILWKLGKMKTTGSYSALFLILYGLLRLFAEMYRLPDGHIGYVFGTDFLTMGMLYSLPMILVGGYIIYTIHQKRSTI